MGGNVHTGIGDARDAMYSSDITDVTVSWDGFFDYESDIAEYFISVIHRPSDSDTDETIHTETVDSTTSSVAWTHFSFANGDSVMVDVEARNGARRRVTISSDPYFIDLSPPHVTDLVDGMDLQQDLSHQSLTDSLTVSWDVEDIESGIQKIEIEVWKQSEGRRILAYPDPLTSGQNREEIISTLSTHTIHSLSLAHGVKYITALTFTNGAGLTSQYETSGVVVDISPPVITSVSVDGEVTVNQDTGSIEVLVPDTTQVSARWSATDADSGVTEILVGVVDENDTFVAPGMTSFGLTSGGVLGNFDLTPWNLYRVGVIAVNHAQLESEIAFSRTFRSVCHNVPFP